MGVILGHATDLLHGFLIRQSWERSCCHLEVGRGLAQSVCEQLFH